MKSSYRRFRQVGKKQYIDHLSFIENPILMPDIEIKKTIQIPHTDAFDNFLNNFDLWWPASYTWSQDKLERIFLGKDVGELCTEIGPDGFRIDWGRIVEMIKGKTLSFSWQISPKREPVPDASKASLVKLSFNGMQSDKTELTLIHDQFGNHGEGHESFREAMASDFGWPFLLQRFKLFAEQN
ncbi:MAG TPA: hypothetical protein DDY13_17075 [Cytophagales bacterium]|jgi:hypothetical protein|nr:hypothetical protein [Cytophagales bacterium]